MKLFEFAVWCSARGLTFLQRRRTQNRMAQRAYRQRKDVRLEDMRQRELRLTDTLALMNKAFVECLDRLTARGLPEIQLRDIRELSMQYAALTAIAQSAKENSSLASSAELDISCVEQAVPLLMDKVAAMPPFQQDEAGSVEIDLDYAMYMGEAGEVPQQLDYFDFAQRVQPVVPFPHKQGRLMNERPAAYHNFMADVPKDVLLPTDLPLPTTYSFGETSFARYLHRKGIEKGVQLLLDPACPPNTYNRLFKLSLVSRDRAKLTAALRDMLDWDVDRALGFSSGPFVHVGGAGTHYPHKDRFGVRRPKIESYNVGLVGLQTHAMLDTRNDMSADITVDIAGFEGEWLDPYDVEGYLEEMGMAINPMSSFAEVEISDYPSTPESMCTPSPTDSRDQAGYSPELDTLEHAFADLNQWNNFAGSFYPCLCHPDVAASSTRLAQPWRQCQPRPAVRSKPTAWEGSGTRDYLLDQSSSMETQSSTRKKVVVLDMAIFVDGTQVA